MVKRPQAQGRRAPHHLHRLAQGAAQDRRAQRRMALNELLPTGFKRGHVECTVKGVAVLVDVGALVARQQAVYVDALLRRAERSQVFALGCTGEEGASLGGGQRAHGTRCVAVLCSCWRRCRRGHTRQMLHQRARDSRQLGHCRLQQHVGAAQVQAQRARADDDGQRGQ